MSQADAALFQARSFIDIGQAPRAVDVLTDALRAEPSHVELLAVLSRAYVVAGDNEAAAEAAHASQTAAGAPVLQAMIVMTKIAANRGQYDVVCETARAIVARWPEEPNGHAWYALGLTRLATTATERATARQAMAAALQIGGRTPELLLNAAWIESRFGDRAACLAHVDEGLATDPSNPDLLKLRAWAVGNARYRAKIMMGILAIDPFDQEASGTLDADVDMRRLRLVRLIFVAPFLLALAVMLPPAVPRAVAVAVVLAVLALRALPHVRFLRALPGSYVRTRWHGQERALAASGALTLLGTALFAVDLPVAGPLVMAAGIAAWGRATLGIAARRADAEPAASDTQHLVLDAHAVWMRSLAAQTAVVSGMTALFGWQFLLRADAGAVAAPFFTVSLVAAVAMLAALVVLGWVGRRRAATATVVSAVVFGLLATALAAGAAVGVVRSTTGDAAGRYEGLPPADRICRRGACYDIRPDLPSMPTRSPIPTISIPSFDVPTFDAPTFDAPTPAP